MSSSPPQHTSPGWPVPDPPRLGSGAAPSRPGPSVPDPPSVVPPPGPGQWPPPHRDPQPEQNRAVLLIIGIMVAVATVAGGYSIVAGSGEDDSAGEEPGLELRPGGQEPETEPPPGGQEPETELPPGGQEPDTEPPPGGQATGDADGAPGGSSQGDVGADGESGGSVAEPPALGDATSPPTGGWIAFHDELAQSCRDGNMFDCDYLYGSVGGVALPDSQPHKDYAGTCGGRIAIPANGECEAWYGSTL